MLVGFAQTPFNLKKKPHTHGADHNQNNPNDGQQGYPTQDFMGHSGLEPGIAGMTGKSV
ncbi:MAG: hypothetical protein ABI945_06520 [Nitrospirales bacterium]